MYLHIPIFSYSGGLQYHSFAEIKQFIFLVFIYFADHGAYGMVSFPHDFLSAQTLGAALKTMHENQRYKQILFYLEACESGSMFQQLPGDIGVLAFTASNATAPSFATYYDPTLETFLADVFR